MKRSKFSDQQIAFVLRHAEEGTAVAEVCRNTGMGEAIFYKWRKEFEALMPSEMKRLKELEEENGDLPTISAQASLRLWYRIFVLFIA
jgi:putative transposase